MRGVSRGLAAFGLLLGLSDVGIAQAASNLRVHNAQGQVFVVWDYDTVNPPLTYEIYFSSLPMTDVSQGQKVGRLFQQEWTGEQLQVIASVLGSLNSTFSIPTSSSRYRLAPDEGLFVFTPTVAQSGYFAVVPEGTTSVTATNQSGLVSVTYDPTATPVRPQLQLTGTTPQGSPYKVYAVWTLGSANIDGGRPDYPVSGNEHKNGAPNLFCIYEPALGAGAGPYPCVFGLHGGEGNFQFWRPGLYPNIGLDITQGLVVAPTDSFVFLDGTTVTDQMTRWFGYANTFDPFSGVVYGQDPPANATIMDYTTRRFDWFLTWLLSSASGYNVDPNRISAIGHSMGGRGANILMRRRPSRFASVVMLTPMLDVVSTGPNTVYGSSAANLLTNVVVGGVPVSYFDVNQWVVPLSDDPHLAFTRIYSGRNDAVAVWDANRVQKATEINTISLGWHQFWDSRVHGVSQWADPPVGEFISPVRTDLASAAAQHKYRANQSYPGFFEVDVNPATPGIQPSIGDGTVGSGALAGTWGGFCEWDVPTETRKQWSCDLYIRQSAPSSIDNWPGNGNFTCKVRLQRPQAFRLAPGAPYVWSLTRLDTGAKIATGFGLADGIGRPSANSVVIFPQSVTKVRLEFRMIPMRIGF